MIILKAIERNWGLIGPGDWDKHSWKINDDGWYQYKESYRSMGEDYLTEIPDVVEEDVLSPEQMKRLKAAMDRDWPDNKTDACDGTAWEFKLYDNGKIIKHRDLGYIYGIEPYESIVTIITEGQNYADKR